MTHDLSALLGPLGVVRTTELAGQVDKHTITAWVRNRRLLRPCPSVLVHPDHCEEWPTRAMAAVLATDGALSHTSALAIWRVLPKEGHIHVSIPVERRAIQAPGLTVHRGRASVLDRLGYFPVTPLPRSLVDTWGSAHRSRATPRDSERARAAVIDTIRDRRLKARELRIELDAHQNLPGRRALVELLDLIDGGCQSELEI